MGSLKECSEYLFDSVSTENANWSFQSKISRSHFGLHFSSPEPKAHWWGYRIGRPLSSTSVRRQHSLTIFSSETTGPIEALFHMESPWDGGTKVCSNGHGHMTKMAAMPIYHGKKS